MCSVGVRSYFCVYLGYETTPKLWEWYLYVDAAKDASEWNGPDTRQVQETLAQTKAEEV